MWETYGNDPSHLVTDQTGNFWECLAEMQVLRQVQNLLQESLHSTLWSRPGHRNLSPLSWKKTNVIFYTLYNRSLVYHAKVKNRILKKKKNKDVVNCFFADILPRLQRMFHLTIELHYSTKTFDFYFWTTCALYLSQNGSLPSYIHL